METNSHEATELYLHIKNSRDLYERFHVPVITRMRAHLERGTYSPKEAIKSFKRIADAGAKSYVEEFGTKADRWHNMFSVADREAVARELMDDCEQDWRAEQKK
jgi:hypothetical protein